MQTIPAGELKRRGLAALEDMLDRGPVHVVSNNRLACVVLSEAEYERLRRRDSGEPRADIWGLLLAEPAAGGPQRSREDIDADLAADRESWSPSAPA